MPATNLNMHCMMSQYSDYNAATTDLNVDMFIFIQRQYDTYIFNKKDSNHTIVTCIYAMLSAIHGKPFSLGLKYCSSKRSALQECHPVTQRDEALESKHTDSGCQAQCAPVLSLPPHSFRQLYELGIACPPKVSILLSLEIRFLIPLEWQKYGSLFQELETSCLHPVNWNLCLSGGCR